MMRCPFRYRHRTRFSFGVAGEFVDFIERQDDIDEAAFNRDYPTCWDKFLHWLGWR